MRDWTNESVKLLLKQNMSSNAIETVRRLSRKMVHEALRSGWTGPPYDMFELASVLGHEVTSNSGIPDARLISQKGNSAIIEYNPNQSYQRINFSIAHEIGHTLFSDFAAKTRNRLKVRGSDEWQLEYLCNVAASEFLLPYGVFDKEKIDLKDGFEDFLLLSDKYHASLESTLIRYIETTRSSTSLIVCERSMEGVMSVQYVHRSETWTGVEHDTVIDIPRNSCAHECARPGFSAIAEEKWPTLAKGSLRVCAIGLRELKSTRAQRVAIVVAKPNQEIVETGNLLKVRGDVLMPRGEGRKIIAQVVNYQGGLGAGFGKAISRHYPQTKTTLKGWKAERTDFQLGNTKLIDVGNGVFVMQMLAQNGFAFKNGRTPLDYSALQMCLEDLRNAAESKNASVHMPLIGAGQAGGNWSIIEAMIKEELVAYNIDVTIYTLPGHKAKKKLVASPTLFD